jgi:hypothetical protein
MINRQTQAHRSEMHGAKLSYSDPAIAGPTEQARQIAKIRRKLKSLRLKLAETLGVPCGEP